MVVVIYNNNVQLFVHSERLLKWVVFTKQVGIVYQSWENTNPIRILKKIERC